MKTNKEMIEELKTKAVDWQTEDDGSGHKGETTYTFYLADIEQLLIKHEEAVVERENKLWRQRLPENTVSITIEARVAEHVLANRKFVSMQSIKASNGRTLLLEAEASAHQILEALTTNPTSDKPEALQAIE